MTRTFCAPLCLHTKAHLNDWLLALALGPQQALTLLEVTPSA